jgi:plasmid stability protein
MFRRRNPAPFFLPRSPVWRGSPPASIDHTVDRLQNGSVLEAAAMPTTLTLKNVPDDVYERLKASAEMHRRSLNSEAIVCLESVLMPGRVEPAERIARARALRGALGRTKFLVHEIDALKREGRR